MGYSKPLPVVDAVNAPFWTGCRAGELRLQRCTQCGHLRYPVSPVCPDCLSEELEWARVSGRGTVLASIVFHRAYHPAFASDVPYCVALIALDEGPRMVSNVVGCPPDRVRVGDRVSVVFQQATDEISIPKFELEHAGA